MKLQDFLHYYLGCRCFTYAGHGTLQEFNSSRGNWYIELEKGGATTGNINDSYKECPEESKAAFPKGYPPSSILKPILRRLEDMTEAEMVNLLTDLFPFDMQDKPTADEFSMEMFYNDDGLMVDGDVSVGANYTCRCYEGQIAIKQCGTICFFDEAGNQEHGINVPKAFHFLLQKHFDLFGLINAGLAIDAKTITQ